MIASVHLADLSPRGLLGALREQPKPGRVPGLRYADLNTTAPLSSSALPAPSLGRMGLLAVWDDDGALERFLADAPLARRFGHGWHVRLEPLRATGAWTGMPPLVEAEQPVDEDEPVVVLTYGRMRYRVAHRFLRASAVAEGQAVENPAVVASTAMARPPRTVSTFSVWRSARAMKEYAYAGGGHTAAMRGMHQHRFHHEWLFARFRPYAAAGQWDGREPVAEARAA